MTRRSIIQLIERDETDRIIFALNITDMTISEVHRWLLRLGIRNHDISIERKEA